MLSNSLNKAEIRKIFKAKRSKLSPQEVEQESNLINQNFIKNLLPQLLEQNNNAIFAIYLPMLNEVKTNLIIEYFAKNNISFAYPKIVKDNAALNFILAQKNSDFVTNKSYKNILEPISGQIITPNFIIMPLVAYDNNCNRIGMGGGFFDRTIAKLKIKNCKVTTIALAYDIQGLNHIINSEITDQKPDFIITQSKILSSNQ